MDDERRGAGGCLGLNHLAANSTLVEEMLRDRVHGCCSWSTGTHPLITGRGRVEVVQQVGIGGAWLCQQHRVSTWALDQRAVGSEDVNEPNVQRFDRRCVAVGPNKVTQHVLHLAVDQVAERQVRLVREQREARLDEPAEWGEQVESRLGVQRSECVRVDEGRFEHAVAIRVCAHEGEHMRKQGAIAVDGNVCALRLGHILAVPQLQIEKRAAHLCKDSLCGAKDGAAHGDDDGVLGILGVQVEACHQIEDA